MSQQDNRYKQKIMRIHIADFKNDSSGYKFHYEKHQTMNYSLSVKGFVSGFYAGQSALF